MNTNKILTDLGYRGHPLFGEIAQWARQFDDEQSLVLALGKHYPLRKAIGLNDKPAPLNTWLPEVTRVESSVYDQINTALRLPVAVKGALMPDAHPGYSLPIGGVVALDNAVAPAFVGFDIACRMRCSIFINDGVDMVRDLHRTEKHPMYLEYILKSTSFGVGSTSVRRTDHEVMHDPLWSDLPILRNLKSLAQSQLGSSGSGNHFCNLMTGIAMSDDLPGLRYGNMFAALLTHSGSRGVGGKLGKYYADLADREVKARGFDVPKGYGWLDLSTEAGQEYWAVMQLMGRYAQANHQIIHTNFTVLTGLYAETVVENHHNFAHKENGLIVHRKGATPAGLGVFGVIPGSSGTQSYIVRGEGNKASLESASHGAGRVSSRSKAKEVFNQDAFDQHMRERGITHYGVASDESWAAYKPITEVMSAQRELVDTVAVLLPRIVVMGGLVRSDDGD